MNDALSSRSLARWLDVICLLILAMIAVGGITRLTDSGLSMVRWEPILGAVPPLNEADWQERFAQYREHPEFKQLKPDMTLGQFKWIYFWEYLHRLLGRLIGIAYAVPFLAFLVRGRIRGMLAGRLSVGFALGGLQGVVGWWMVKSGLSENPFVSHYRLAAHLGLALLVLGYLWWIRLDLTSTRHHAPRLHRAGLIFLALVALQITYGAFVAGLNAGFFFNTFPLMGGRWLPPGLSVLAPWMRNFADNAVTVQFIHRWLGVALGAATIFLWWSGSTAADAELKRRLVLVIQLTLLQVALGIMTLVLAVPVWLGVAHQVNAALLLLSVLALLHGTRARPAA